MSPEKDPFKDLRRLADAARASANDFELWSHSNFQGERPPSTAEDFIGWTVLRREPDSPGLVAYRVEKLLIIGAKFNKNPEIQVYDGWDADRNQHRFSFDDLVASRLLYNKNNIEYDVEKAAKNAMLPSDVDSSSDEAQTPRSKRKTMQLPLASKVKQPKSKLADSTNQKVIPFEGQGPQQKLTGNPASFPMMQQPPFAQQSAFMQPKFQAFVQPEAVQQPQLPNLFPCRRARHPCWTCCQLVAPSANLPDGKSQWENADAKRAYCVKCNTFVPYESRNPRDVIKHYESNHEKQTEEKEQPVSAVMLPPHQWQPMQPTVQHFAPGLFQPPLIQQNQQQQFQQFQQFMQMQQQQQQFQQFMQQQQQQQTPEGQKGQESK